MTLIATTILTGLLIVSVSRSVLGPGGDGRRGAALVARLARRRLHAAQRDRDPGGGRGPDHGRRPAGRQRPGRRSPCWSASAARLAFVVGVRLVHHPDAAGAARADARGQEVLADDRAGRGGSPAGSFWRLFGIYLLTTILAGIIAQIIVFPATLIAQLVLRDPTATSFGSVVVIGIANVIASTLSTTFVASVVALLYIDVRMRREGLDVELARAAETTA